jgi:hypothetical protein
MSNTTILVSRKTARGPLVVSIEGTTLSATLGGATIPAGIGHLPKPFAGPLGAMHHTIGSAPTVCPLYVAEHKAIQSALDAAYDAARAAKLATLPGQREALAIALYNCESGAFPGSAAWRAERAAIRALAVFDAAHPEVIASIQAEPREGAGEESLEGRQ